MKAFSGGEGSEAHHVVNNYPWGDLKEGTVVDVSSPTPGILAVRPKAGFEIEMVFGDVVDVAIRLVDLMALLLSKLPANSRRCRVWYKTLSLLSPQRRKKRQPT